MTIIFKTAELHQLSELLEGMSKSGDKDLEMTKDKLMQLVQEHLSKKEDST